MIVVKVGGSLYDHPSLGPVLLKYLDSLDEPLLIVPGGGPFADAIRDLDHIHSLGDERSHFLALDSMNLGGAFLRSLGVQAPILDAHSFDIGTLPQSWNVTSDSIAAAAAIRYRASRLILLKSVDAGTPDAVDAHFAQLQGQFTFPFELINFRRRLEESQNSCHA